MVEELTARKWSSTRVEDKTITKLYLVVIPLGLGPPFDPHRGNQRK